jgi:hypothetical protein
MKPSIIAKAMSEYPTDIVYLDADAVVHGPMTLFDNWYGNGSAADIGVHYRMERELLGGTLYLRNSEIMREFLDDVAALMEQCNLVWQQAAQTMLARRLDIQVKRLPASYTRIFDAPDMAAIQPVIEHMQYSRKVAH